MAINDMKWEAAILRMTAFPSPNNQIESSDWWMDVVGEPPEQRTEQPRTGEKREEAEYRNGRLILQIHPINVHWSLQVVDQPLDQSGSIATLGTFSDELSTFVMLINRWFEIEATPPLSRLAFGAVLLKPVESRKIGYEVLSNYLPNVSIDSDNSSDFLYQINRRRISHGEIADLQINRLTKWSVITRQLRQFEVSKTATISEFPAAYACRLELDINTSQEYDGIIEREQLSGIYQELVDLGVEIAKEGDIP